VVAYRLQGGRNRIRRITGAGHATVPIRFAAVAFASESSLATARVWTWRNAALVEEASTASASMKQPSQGIEIGRGDVRPERRPGACLNAPRFDEDGPCGAIFMGACVEGANALIRTDAYR
jgi:hypothetical protein